jgi:prephenate dehydratase
MIVGYLGPMGTFSQEVAEIYALRKQCRLKEFFSIQDVILAVHHGEVDEGIVPIENSLEGSVNVTIDMLVHDVDLYIIDELVIPVSHCLLARADTSEADIQLILSHAQALGQCRGYLRTHFPKVREQLSLSTAEAARQVANSREPWAAIAGRKAGVLFNLKVLAEDIQDHKGNCTRFVVLGSTWGRPTGRDKTSIAFTVNDEPGSLLKALEIFANAGINLKKIESRPMRTMLGQYLFLVDLEGHKEDERISKYLGILAKESTFYKFLGSYPIGQWK